MNLIVTMFLDTADLRASRRQQILLADWDGILDRFLTANDLPLLRGTGTISALEAEQAAHRRYVDFDQRRKLVPAMAADAGDIAELGRIASEMHGQESPASTRPRPLRTPPGKRR